MDGKKKREGCVDEITRRFVVAERLWRRPMDGRGRKFYRRSIGYMGLSRAVMCTSVCVRVCARAHRTVIQLGSDRIVCRYTCTGVRVRPVSRTFLCGSASLSLTAYSWQGQQCGAQADRNANRPKSFCYLLPLWNGDDTRRSNARLPVNRTNLRCISTRIKWATPAGVRWTVAINGQRYYLGSIILWKF